METVDALATEVGGLSGECARARSNIAALHQHAALTDGRLATIEAALDTFDSRLRLVQTAIDHLLERTTTLS